YWLQKQPIAMMGKTSDLFVLMDKYIERGRGLAAIISANQRLSEIPSTTLLYLLDIVVKEINSQDIQFDTMLSYYVKKVFDELKQRNDVSETDLAFKEMTYLPCFPDSDEPLILHRLMMKKPEVFIEAICIVYRSDEDEQTEPSELEVKRATSIYRLLEKLRILPGQIDNEIDQDKLEDWCENVRHLAKLHHRQEITDHVIGKILAHAPNSSVDNSWPHEAIRHIIEILSSDELEQGIQIGRYNKRGVFARMRYEGGNQERILAEQYREWANSMPHCVRTSAMLFRIADEWEYSAKNADIRAAKADLK
ncbi:XRE family transcriptional regulator, partial [Escherichia coli]|nr:XRE family transcriptional regulator [Escherichia coli]HBD1615458.1 XRE family transcriptional regulator [Escherichia coli]HEF0860229.1 XRE family transcriptional regulator [Escherichia coli]